MYYYGVSLFPLMDKLYSYTLIIMGKNAVSTQASLALTGYYLFLPVTVTGSIIESRLMLFLARSDSSLWSNLHLRDEQRSLCTL